MEKGVRFAVARRGAEKAAFTAWGGIPTTQSWSVVLYAVLPGEESY